MLQISILYSTKIVNRIIGLETEYGISCVSSGERKLSPDEIARFLFRKVVSWGRSSNVFLPNGARLYLDVGSHPEYATAECRTAKDLLAQDIAGERILEDLLIEAQDRLTNENIQGDIYLFKNNTDSAGNSYGCHENYLIPRAGSFSKYSDVLIPFLISRQIICGAGKVVNGPRGSHFALSQRAEHMWEGVSSATTRSRPIINTRDEPHADPEEFRRLHIIVGDSNMSDCTTLLKVISVLCVLDLIESDMSLRDFTFDNPMKSIRDIANDLTGKQLHLLANGKKISALDMQNYYFEKCAEFNRIYDSGDPEMNYAMNLWERTLHGFEKDSMSEVATEIDWVVKFNLIEKYISKRSVTLSDPVVAQLDLTYHDVRRDRGTFYLLQKAGLAKSYSSSIDVDHAKEFAPNDTRAHLRGKFIKAAQACDRDFTVDWVHLKLNDQAQRTVLCKDPFLADDERVDNLISGMASTASRSNQQ